MARNRRRTPTPHSVMKWVQDWCDEQDKSTEFMIAYMCDQLTTTFDNLEYDQAHDMVMDYLVGQSDDKSK